MHVRESIDLGATRPRETRDILDEQRAALRELRNELRSTFPRVRARALVSIARHRGLTEFPPGFFVHGRFSNRRRFGPLATLRRLARSDGSSDAATHPLFSGEFYLTAHDDVRASHVHPWVHYQVYGRAEGRSPHPLVDVKQLSASMTSVAIADVVDEYLANPHKWIIDSGPYVEVQRFMLYGDWDGVTHPLEQIVTSHLGSHWVHSRLMLIDITSKNEQQARMNAAGFLLSRHTGTSRFSRMQRWSRTEGSASQTSGAFTVIPGFFIGGPAGELVGESANAVSPDGTIVRLERETVGVLTGRLVTGTCLRFATSVLDRGALGSLLSSAQPGTIFAPHSRAQEIAARQLHRDLGTPNVTVLEFGQQVQVKVAEVGVDRTDASDSSPAPWDWNAASDAPAITIVIPAGRRREATGDPRLRALLARGASLCVIDETGLNTWLPIIQSRRTVVADASLIGDLAGFVDPAVLRILPQARAQ